MPTIRYKSGKYQGNADTLSRFPLPERPATVPIPTETVAVLEQLSSIPLTAVKIKQRTEYDPILSKAKRYTQLGWPETLDTQDADLKPFLTGEMS